MERLVKIVSIDEEFEKARVKPHIRTMKGKLGRVREHRRGRELYSTKFGNQVEHKGYIVEPYSKQYEDGISWMYDLKTKKGRTVDQMHGDFKNKLEAVESAKKRIDSGKI